MIKEWYGRRWSYLISR